MRPLPPHRLLFAFLAAAAIAAIAADPPAAPPDANAANAAGAPTAPQRSHRPLRENVEPSLPEPTAPSAFAGYPEAPPFAVAPRKDQLGIYPCTICHKTQKPNAKPRKLAAPHVAALPHGNGRMWCIDCHHLKDRDVLQTLGGQKVDFDESHLVCGQCHGNRHRDWHFGAHGKRMENWQGERVLYACTHCHDAHDPTIKPRAPGAPPPVRAGLAPMNRTPHAAPPVWERAQRPPVQ